MKSNLSKQLEARGWKVINETSNKTTTGRTLHVVEVNPKGNSQLLVNAIKEITGVDTVRKETLGSSYNNPTSLFYWYT